MDSSICFKINTPKVIDESFEDEQVVINLDTGNYYSLNKISSYIWSLIDSGETVGDITECISQLYQGDREEIEKAVHAFIAELEKEQLIISEKRLDAGTKQYRERQASKHATTEKQDFQAPSIQKYIDMQELLLLDPIHEVDARGWPSAKKNASELA
jgi:hypothetical protein